MNDRAAPPICIVHIAADGCPNYIFNGEVEFLIIDERAPHDRVYQMTEPTPRALIAELIGHSPIGNCHDSRHAAAAHRITRFLEGRSHLEAITTNGATEAATPIAANEDDRDGPSPA